ncbi:MAG TPA: DNA mismatch repair endonuclease MutL [Bdellovibrionota bacterium]|nr:DNA mismatch repair endonuclease MutL [Bdellovibrionota bacterium]
MIDTTSTTRPKVQLLPELVAERIAAGEVVDRPASVVKELVENALDAKTTEITVLLENGGRGVIEVIDNGFGMEADDLELAVRRHATSKIRSVEDLERLATLGFRGEALPSIAAVAHFSLMSRALGAEDAHEVRPDGESAPRAKKVTHGHFLGSHHGTRARVESLFSTVPARLKFLKSPRSEVAQVREWLERLSLTRPEVGFRLVSEERTVLQLRPQSQEQRARAVLDEGGNYPLVFRERGPQRFDGGDGVRIRVAWLQGYSGPGARRLLQVVNGRAVRDRMLQQAMLAAFRQTLLPGQYPALALILDVPGDRIDVNVHPAKTEIRFAEPGPIFTAVSGFLADLIALEGAPASARAPRLTLVGGTQTQWNQPRPLEKTESLWTAAEPAAAAGESAGAPVATPSGTPAAQPLHALSHGRYVGSLFQTYLLFDLGQELAVIDQHAAHERIRFEQLRDRVLRGDPDRQQLLLPEAVHVSRERIEDLRERLPWLEKMGFEAEIFGEDSVLFRAVPSIWGTQDLRTRLGNLIERTLETESRTQGGGLALDEALFEKLASEACRSSRRAGDRLGPEEARHLLDRLFDCAHPWNCPHGRPTVTRVPEARLEEWFLRRV